MDSLSSLDLLPLQSASLLPTLSALMQAEKETGPVRAEEQVGSWYSNPVGRSAAAGDGTGVGRYLKLPAQPGAQAVSVGQPDVPPAKKAKQTAGYGNFDAW